MHYWEAQSAHTQNIPSTSDLPLHHRRHQTHSEARAQHQPRHGAAELAAHAPIHAAPPSELAPPVVPCHVSMLQLAMHCNF